MRHVDDAHLPEYDGKSQRHQKENRKQAESANPCMASIDDNSEKLSENIFLLLGKSDWMVVTKGNRSLRDRQRSLSATGY